MAYTAPSITASGTTFAQFQAGGASGHLELLIAQQPLTPTAAPSSAPTTAASGSGHTLPAATDYYVVCTETNGFGETTASPVSSGTGITLGQELTVTYPTLQTGNTARNLYISTSSTGPFLLCATGVTTATTVLTAPAPTNSYAVQPPTVNTAGLTFVDANGNTRKRMIEMIRSCKTGNLEEPFRNLRSVIEEFNAGRPAPFGATIRRLQECHATFAMLDTLCKEMGTLIDANAGTLYVESVGPGLAQNYRGWP
ncbi:MAG: hypothetical protein ACLQIB_40525 [Isosphaeraceae bacterium]